MHKPKQDFDSISANASLESPLQPKGVIDIPQLADCTVSDLYVAKHQRQLIYCIKLTWSADMHTDSSLGSYLQDDNFSQASDLNFASEVNSPTRSQADRKVASPEVIKGHLQKQSSSSSLTPKVLRKKLAVPFQRLTAKQRAPKHQSSRHMHTSTNGGDQNNRNAGPGMHRRFRSESNIMRKLVLSSLEEEEDDGLNHHSSVRSEIPAMVEWLEGAPAGAEHDEIDNNTLLNALHPPLVIDAPAAMNPVLSRSELRRSASESAAREEQEFLQHQYETKRKETRRKNRKLMVQSGQYAAAAGAAIGLTILTAGVGLVAGLALLGATAVAGGGAAGVGSAWKKKVNGEIVMAGSDYEIMRMWKAYLDASSESAEIKQSRWGQLFVSDGRKSALLPQILEISAIGNGNKLEERVARFDNCSCWRPVQGGWSSFLGIGTELRIFREECGMSMMTKSLWQIPSIFDMRKSSTDQPPCPPVKAHLVLHTSPLDAFLCLMSSSRMTEESERKLSPNSEQVSSFRLVHNIDEHSDIIHLVFRPMNLFPSWTLPRDYCLFRYWRLEQDGSYIVCYESMQHQSCPPNPGFVRGEMSQVVTIAPQKKAYRRKLGNNAPSECFMTTVVQVDPKGWIPLTPVPFLSHQTYAEAFGVAALSQMTDIRDAIDQDRFLPINVCDTDQAMHAQSYKRHEVPPAIMRNRSLDSNGADDTVAEEVDYDFSFCQHESLAGFIASKGDAFFMNHPPCTPCEKWAEPDPNSFRVRGPNYLKDHNKINAGPSIGRLLCADVVTVDEPIYSGMSVHPTERIQMALNEEQKLSALGQSSPMPPFVFVVNIVLPGPPFYHGVFYYAIDDMSQIDGTSKTPSSKLCNEFFFGESDEFRDKTFKMIPQIVEGNFLVKKAVGSTPAIMGKKLRQLYVRDKNRRFMEVILDCGSSQVATGVIRLSLGYATSLVVDMGFLFEANDESTLPERLFGAVRMKHPEFSTNLRKVHAVI
jgi:hypothetical protein